MNLINEVIILDFRIVIWLIWSKIMLQLLEFDESKTAVTSQEGMDDKSSKKVEWVIEANQDTETILALKRK